jgi:hypothetical protein
MTKPTAFQQPFSEEEKVHILLQEYESLRDELNTRTNNTFQLTAIAAAVAVWILGRETFDFRFWLALVISVDGVPNLQHPHSGFVPCLPTMAAKK